MQKRVLIVDDEDLVRNYVRRALLSRSWDVSEATNGAAALALIAREDFDLVVCDLKMPDMRGEEVIKQLRSGKPAVKIIVITGSVSDLSNPLVPGVDIDGFLIKPFGIDDIRNMADKVISGK